MNDNLIDEIKSLNIMIGNKLFNINKDNLISKYPSPLQYAICNYLDNNNDRDIYQKDLQEEFHISKAAISDVVNSMEKKNIITRIPSSIDGRLNKIIMTDFGIECFSKIKSNNNKFNNKLSDCLSDDEANTFISTINKLKNYIEGID